MMKIIKNALKILLLLIKDRKSLDLLNISNTVNYGKKKRIKKCFI